MTPALKRIIRHFTSADDFLADLNRQVIFDDELQTAVTAIIEQVRQEGDQALLHYTKQFDSVARTELEVTATEWQKLQNLPLEIEQLLAEAAANIRRFHQQEMKAIQDWQLTANGAMVGQRIVPIERVGVYVPGGKAAYPSSVLMNVIPAQVAGVPEIVLVSPPDRETGLVNPLVLTAARLLQVSEIYAVGGVQAIAALAYGTETIPPVAKITGPGNRYVTEAKRQVYGKVGIDALAGPSEIVILADETANPVHLAADLLSQAEHDENARAILISTNDQILAATEIELERQLSTLPKAAVARTALAQAGALIKVTDLSAGIALINKIAPEHLELQLSNPEKILPLIKSAGAIFLGSFTPEPVGDYWAGSNHILPTAGGARFSSALSVRDFLHWTSIISYDQKALAQHAIKIARFARLEGLEAHARAIECRATVAENERIITNE